LLLPKEPKIKMNITGNKKLKNRALGLLRIERKLAFTIAKNALAWLYCCMA
jgi:hypothetical protein